MEAPAYVLEFEKPLRELARQLDELRLVQPLVLRDREQNGILPWRQTFAAELDLEHLGGALSGSV